MLYRWDALRASEGWAALQHHVILRATLTVKPPAHFTGELGPPRLLVTLKQGSFFTIVPRNLSSSDSTIPPSRWHAGNIYDMERALPHPVDLPSEPSPNGPTIYDFFVSGDYEVRNLLVFWVRHANC